MSSKATQQILRHQKLSTTELYIQRLNSSLEGTINLLAKAVREDGGPLVGENSEEGVK